MNPPRPDGEAAGTTAGRSVVTSHDVARLAGVTQPTVSRALRGEAGVSEATKQRILQAAEQLGYVPMQSGRNLATRETRRIGIVAGELTNPFFSTLVGPLHNCLDSAGYRTILLTDEGGSTVGMEPLIDGTLDGALLTTSNLDSPLVHELQRRGVPFVQVGREVDGAVSDACVFDNVGGARAVAELLLDLGHRRIGAIHGPLETSTGRDRERGLREALAEAEIAVAPARSARGRFVYDTGQDALPRLLGADDPPTAVFCANDVIALGALNAAHRLGVAVPGELTIVGFDDIAMSSWEVFQLTTVNLDFHRMADASCGLLLDRIRRPGEPFRREVLPVSLTLRRTHGPPA
ncbi:LacI family DNA-binding transcriptional regulator [Nocardioides hungaricus]